MNKLFYDLRQQARVSAGILDGRIYSGPWTVQLDLTNECNNDCIACWCNSPLLDDKKMPQEVKEKTLPFEKVIELIDELAELGVRSVYLTGGGEPFMHPRALDVMRYVKSKGIHLDMSTNFTLVDKEVAEKLLEAKVDHLNLSLWSGDRDVYAVQHPNKSAETFDQMLEVIDYIVKRKKELNQTVPGLGIYNVINIHNYKDFNNMVELAYEHKVDDLQFTHVDTMPERTDVLSLSPDQLRELAGDLRDFEGRNRTLSEAHAHRLNVIGFETFRQRTESSGASEANYDAEILASLPSCYAGWSFARVLANGEVNSCLKSFKIPVGSIYEKSFTEIWCGHLQKEFRRHTKNYDPADPYFENMGNDTTVDGQGCIKCCDNIGLNLSIHHKLETLTWWQRLLLKGFSGRPRCSSG